MIPRALAIAVVLLALSGCATWSEWFESPIVESLPKIEGPVYGSGNGRSKVMHSCSKGPVLEQIWGPGRCRTAFTLSSGKLLPMEDLERELDDYLRSLDGFSSWPTTGDRDGPNRSPPRRFYLLSLQPTLVLVVPVPAGRAWRGSCSGPANRHTCISSKLLPEGYPYAELPKADGEVFWFAPGITRGLVPALTQDGRYRFPAHVANASLVRKDGQWAFSRE